MQSEVTRPGTRCQMRSDKSWSVQKTSTSIRRRPCSRDDRYGPNLRKIYGRLPWMRFSHRGVDLRYRASRSRVLVTEILPFAQVLLQDIETTGNARGNEAPMTPTEAWALENSDAERRNEGVWCARLSMSSLSPEASELILGKEFDAVWQGENVALMDGKFDITPRLGARPKPSGDLPPLNRAFPVNLIAWQGSHLAVQNRDVEKDLKFLDFFEKDPKTFALENIEKRSYLLVWDSWRWKRAQVKEYESAAQTMLVTLIDEALEKRVPKVEELLGVAPTTWRQPPAAGVLVEMPAHLSHFNVNDYCDEEVFCVLRKPVGGTRYAGQLFVKSDQGELVELSGSVPTIVPSTAQLGLCFVMHVDTAAKEIHVVNSQVMDEHGTFLSEKLADLVDKRPISRAKKGQAVLALMFDLLCRAVITKIQADGILVKFVDYGNSALVNKVFQIPDELLTAPALAFSLPLDPNQEGQFEFGRVLTVTSIDGDCVKFARLE